LPAFFGFSESQPYHDSFEYSTDPEFVDNNGIMSLEIVNKNI